MTTQQKLIEALRELVSTVDLAQGREKAMRFLMAVKEAQSLLAEIDEKAEQPTEKVPDWQQLFEGMRLERNIMQQQAIDAKAEGRREGLKEALVIAVNSGPFTTIQRIRALLDSQNAAGEQDGGMGK